MDRLLLSGAAALILSLGAQASGYSPASPPAGAGQIVDTAVTFTVDNVNRSLASCPTDGKRYVLSGHIVGPATAMHDGAAATLYLHGAAVPEATWRMPISGYDHGLEMARLGHISVTLDRLSYGASPTPNGHLTCWGGHADITHQIVQQLRAGNYGSSAPIRFARLVLAGHSAGQEIAEIAAYSFGDIDGLIVGGWSDTAFSAEDLRILLPTILDCARGGERKRPGEPGGYAYTFKDRVPELLFHNAEQAVVDAYLARHERDACDASVIYTPVVNALLQSRIKVPVLIFFGLNDALWPPPAGERERALYSGSDDVTLLEIPDTGHSVMLERTAPVFRATICDWLNQRGL